MAVIPQNTDFTWQVSDDPVPYPAAIEVMEQRVAEIEAGRAGEMVWLLQHPPLYTAGTSTGEGELLDAHFPVFKTGRGGRLTYHGPGQRVVYVMADLRHRGRDLRQYVCMLERVVIEALAEFGIKGACRDGRVGIWVDHDGREEKIAAIGVRVRRWVAYHGFALNVNPDLTHFQGIVPCGLSQFGVTSMDKLGARVSMAQVDAALHRAFLTVFF